MDIDLVYMWVDGNDPKWQAKYNSFIGNVEEVNETNCKGRTADNDELKYSLRSIEKYAPWIRKIFIITDDQIPDWLDTANPKITIVDHKEILPPESLPCFNASIIEHYPYKIPGLSEHFLLANDDTFINKPVTPQDFFAEDGFPIIRLNRKPFRKLRRLWRERICKKPLKNYSRIVSNAAELIEKRYGVYYTGIPHHNIDAYLKSNCKKVTEDTFEDEFRATQTNQMRSPNDIHRVIYDYVALVEKQGHLCYVTQKNSLHVLIHKEHHYEKLKKYNPMLFCMNDSQYAQDSDRVKAKTFLDNYFPEKSQFER
jgi:hypothetical protein